MRVATLLLGLLALTSAHAQGVIDPQTGEPVPLGLTAPPDVNEVHVDRRGGEAFLVQHLPAGTTKLVRTLPEAFVASMDGAQLIVRHTEAASPGGEPFLEVARIDLPALPTDAVVVDELLYVTLSKAPGLVVYDLAGVYDDTPEFEIVEAGRADLPGAFAVAVAGETLYLGRGTAGVSFHDADPASLAQLALVDTPGSANGLATFSPDLTSDILLVVADGNVSSGDDVRILDVTDLGAITEVGSVETDGFATYAAVQYYGSRPVGFVTGAAGLITLELDAGPPAVLDVLDIDGTTYEVAFAGETAYVNGLDGVLAVDISDPETLVAGAAYDFGGQGLSLDVDPEGGLVFAGDRFGGLRVLDAETLAELDRFENGGFSHKVYAGRVGNLQRFFVTDLAGRLRTFAPTPDGAVEVVEARLDVPSNTQDVLVTDNDVAYITHSAGLGIYDVSEIPYTQLADVATQQSYGLTLADDVLYAANGFGGVLALDVSNPAAPTVLSSTPVGSNVVDVVSAGPNQIYVASFGGGMLSYDVSDPAAPVQLDAEPGFGFLNAIAPFDEELDGRVAFVADGQQGLRLVSVADPADLVSLATAPTSTQARDVAASATLTPTGTETVAAVADDFYGLRTFTVSPDGSAAVLRDAFPTADRGIGVTMSELDFPVDPVGFPDAVYLAAGEAGVYIYWLGQAVSSEPTANASTLQLAARPNPARGSARVTFELSAAMPVEAAVYDVLGRRVATLASGALAAGPHELAAETAGWAPGVYTVRVRAGEAVATQRLTVLR